MVTGANGEVGHAIIPILSQEKKVAIIALDIRELDDRLKPFVHEAVVADILDHAILGNLLKEHSISTVFHLAAILSSAGEKDPYRAHKVNVEGTASLLETAEKTGRSENKTIKFVFPSTIAVYGLPDLETKISVQKVKEEDFLSPITMYGINKLYCETLGKYYSNNYQLLAADPTTYVDFRCVRFPGIISALTLPSGGTSDYAPEMIHSAVRGEKYVSFVRPDTKIPFIVMPDAVGALIQLSQADLKNLTSRVYNLSAFSVTAGEIEKKIKTVYPKTKVNYRSDKNRQKIVDSWPEDVDDSKAKKDWGWKPKYNLESAFTEYLIPEIRKNFSTSSPRNPRL